MNALLFERPIWFTTSPLEFEEEAQEMEDITYHRPVLVTEAVELLAPRAGALVVDATCGGGGHTEEILRTGADVPTVRAGTPMAEGLMEVTRKGLGMTAIVDEAMRVLGVFTDGDLRRALDASADLRTTRMDQVMSRHAKTVRPTTLAAEAVHLMETHRITSLIVVDADEKIVGALNVHDLLRAGVV